MNIWKPSRNELKVIREVALRSATCRRIKIEAQYRRGPRGVSLNDYLASATPHHAEDTDLEDFADWAEFKRGVPLTDDGYAHVHLLVYKVDPWGWEHHDLDTNLEVYVENGRLAWLYGYSNKWFKGDGTVWDGGHRDWYWPF